MNTEFRLEVKFWGVRGSIPTPAPENLGCGGNTTCLEVCVSDGSGVVIDGGTGARQLGMDLMRRAAGGSIELDILMTHFHWDHIQGIPFFAPLYNPKNRITFHTSRSPEEVRNILEGQMTHPYFPVAFELLGAKREFAGFDTGVKKLLDGRMSVKPFGLNHPQGATGFRIEANGAVIVHACDHEHGDAEKDRSIREAAMEADVLVYDAQFTPDEYGLKKGWGHSTWLEGVKVAQGSNVKHLVLSHHDPSHTDEFMQAVLLEARKEFPNTSIAKEGTSIRV